MKHAAALVCFRVRAGCLEFLLIHPGGPYFARRDLGVWSFPKGECQPGEPLLDAARREFEEEVGVAAPTGATLELGEVRQRNGKRVVAFAVAASEGLEFVKSNEFEIEWPPRSGELRSFPEADRGGWFAEQEARRRLVGAQGEFLDRLAERLGATAEKRAGGAC